MRRIRQIIAESKEEVEQLAVIKYATNQFRENLNGARGKK
jgi:hypothetical protein